MQINTELLKIKKPKQEFWLNHIKQWEASTLSQQAYCLQAGIKHTTFIYWRRQFSFETATRAPQQFAKVEIKSENPADSSQSIKLKLITGNVISIPYAIGISEIVKLIRLLESRDA